MKCKTCGYVDPAGYQGQACPNCGNDPAAEPSAQQPYCCKMREKFLCGIVAVNQSVPDPVDVADFVIDWGGGEEKRPIIIAAKFCPFCGAEIKGTLRATIRKPADE